MNRWITFILPLALFAQEPAKEEAKPAAETKQEAAAAKPDTAPAKEAASDSAAPAAAEKAVEGYVDLGARWVGWAGDYNTYRSIVNQGQGLRLTGLDVNWTPKNSKYFDNIHGQAYNWLGDPNSTARVDVLKRGVYRYLGTFTEIAYFNYLPSFADPKLSQGYILSERAYDTAIRNYDNALEFRPGTRFIPFLNYSRNSDSGSGITPLVLEGNEYPIRNSVLWSQNNYSGGVRIEMNRWHATIEQGGTTFKDDQTVYSTEGNAGNRPNAYLGQYLYLSQGQQFYRVRGSGPYTRALFTANPWNWIDLAGQFLYSNPSVTTNFNQGESGKLAGSDAYAGLFFARATDTYYGDARLPHTSWSGSAEIRPFSRLRVRETYESDRSTNTSTALLNSSLYLTGSTTALPSTETGADRMETSRNRQQIDALFDFGSKVMYRAGYRYEWGNALFRGGQLNTQPYERVELKRSAALLGGQVRPTQALMINVDYEYGIGDKTYFRTGLYDTRKFRIQGRYNLPKNFMFSAIYSYFTNKNPNADVNLDFKTQTASGSLSWLPGGGKNISVVADYTYAGLRSDINYLIPIGFATARSLYIDNSNTGSLLANLRLPMVGGNPGKLTFGGSFTKTAGTREANYYQPFGRIQLPVVPKLDFFAEWRYYGLNQPLYFYEGFRSNQFLAGFRFLI